MSTAARAGAAYFALVFLVGFVLGILRVMIAIPRWGELIGTLIELPVILTACWLICGWVLSRFKVAERWPARVLMGAVAFALLMLAELLLSLTLLGQSIDVHFAGYLTLLGMLGLTGQVLFALFPLFKLHHTSAVDG